MVGLLFLSSARALELEKIYGIEAAAPVAAVVLRNPRRDGGVFVERLSSVDMFSDPNSESEIVDKLYSNQTAIGLSKNLFPRRPRELCPIGIKDLEVVNALLLTVNVGPDNIFFLGYLKQFRSFYVSTPRGIACDHDITIG